MPQLTWVYTLHKQWNSLKPYDFKKYMPQPVSEDHYTIDVHKEGKATVTTIDQWQKNVLEIILMSDINDYRNMRSKYREQMHSMYEIIHGNLDQNIITLLETDSTYTDISIEHDPIELISSSASYVKRKKALYMHSTLSSTLL